ncbi:unnamed protein product [Rangifer tarandus platyrhynchus]|uniref:Uncharacterized protein n=1 Tax=Rangifer tarandus platyrhynchus TaxID=3082113 RepID=A0AC59YV59_RANTA
MRGPHRDCPGTLNRAGTRRPPDGGPPQQPRVPGYSARPSVSFLSSWGSEEKDGTRRLSQRVKAGPLSASRAGPHGAFTCPYRSTACNFQLTNIHSSAAQ